mmetsp:Transcript_3558/g.4473  ORF Transcript_3558/g.4473 Transcript_3558/m.4473 type:complete len:464 (+) Transcript_3558:135-1526(+)|eukprot:CAMPEP_0204831508 /NCGR_PEP_ID=MMETSP1346-20131115/10821_1 /ASSEMBLY_ACC=CAM_ASM_000771 /TAXON_ID=215587 /ORGANISM="Aplanochytrium stocchinoi, Strain GSBS06" /LENGTH=463 /DNA_ID=CAMNT_0051962597 /DNA_START=175 /DNA_END=1569 /DNA_ORIENTATION=-
MGETGTEEAREFAHSIGPAFVKQYYTSLAGTSLSRHDAFYGNTSSFSCNGEPSILGAQKIKEQYVKLGFKEVLVDLEGGTFDFAPSHNGGVLVVVGGSMTFAGDKTCPFTQTFFLAPDEVDGNVSYYVLNDILRFGEEQLQEQLAEPAGDLKKKVADKLSLKSQNQPKEPVTEEVEKNQEISKEEDVEFEKTLKEPVVEKPKPAMGKQPRKQAPKKEKGDNKAEKPASAAPVKKAEGDKENSVKPVAPAKQQQQPVVEEAKPQQLEKPDLPAKPSSWAALVSQSKAAPPQQQPVQKTTQIKTSAPPANAKSTATKTKAADVKQSGMNGSKGGVSGTLFVKEIEKGVNEAVIRSLFAAYGSIKSVEIVRERKFAFISFESPSSVQQVLASPKIVLNGKQLTVQQRTSQAGSRSDSRRDSRRGNRSTRGGSGKDKEKKVSSVNNNTNGGQNGPTAAPAKSRNKKN